MRQLPFKISVLVFITNEHGEHLLIQRRKAPNTGKWSPIGGKLEMATGESPHACAVRETAEETGLAITPSDLHLFAMITEEAYEGTGHWLMFLFDCRKPIPAIPATIDEGTFGFFSRTAIDQLPIPETDRQGLWPIYWSNREGFVALKAVCTPGQPLRIDVEEKLM